MQREEHLYVYYSTVQYTVAIESTTVRSHNVVKGMIKFRAVNRLDDWLRCCCSKISQWLITPTSNTELLFKIFSEFENNTRILSRITVIFIIFIW